MAATALLLQLFTLLSTLISVTAAVKYTPDWKSLDSRPLPAWYDDSKIGIFLHWGLFSVPAYKSAWFVYFFKHNYPDYVKFVHDNYGPQFTFADFAPLFHAYFYNPDGWADIFEASGAKYVVLVTKHHEGFTMWPSNHSWNWNAYDVGPRRDLVAELATAVKKKKDMHFGVYHSLFEFFNPLYIADKNNNYKTQEFVRTKAMPELYELVNNYKPDIVWSDGDWEAPDTYWNSTEFIAWLYNESPVKDTVVINDRWGNNTRCRHGGFWNCHDKFNPGKLFTPKWENCMTVDKRAWTHRRDVTAEDCQTVNELISVMAETVSCGGNLLMNVGPSADGRIIPIFEQRLRQFGAWMKVNGEAIYKSKPWHTQRDPFDKQVWYTSKKDVNGTSVYAIILNWPKYNALTLGAPVTGQNTVIKMLGYDKPFKFYEGLNKTVEVIFPNIPVNLMPSYDAWVLKMTNLENQHVPHDDKPARDAFVKPIDMMDFL
ncbi:alpha-L-fucosidase-like [Ylistrum balloti]|uniref:alpha-L-fucosidase-like n=1 Tax=Ylistrum balloti TaxID=509963 RepID=UPI00290585D6|nr:alpha-L-fucosidase-like [Ylistrum balloti]